MVETSLDSPSDDRLGGRVRQLAAGFDRVDGGSDALTPRCHLNSVVGRQKRLFTKVSPPRRVSALRSGITRRKSRRNSTQQQANRLLRKQSQGIRVESPYYDLDDIGLLRPVPIPERSLTLGPDGRPKPLPKPMNLHLTLDKRRAATLGTGSTLPISPEYALYDVDSVTFEKQETEKVSPNPACCDTVLVRDYGSSDTSKDSTMLLAGSELRLSTSIYCSVDGSLLANVDSDENSDIPPPLPLTRPPESPPPLPGRHPTDCQYLVPFEQQPPPTRRPPPVPPKKTSLASLIAANNTIDDRTRKHSAPSIVAANDDSGAYERIRSADTSANMSSELNASVAWRNVDADGPHEREGSSSWETSSSDVSHLEEAAHADEMMAGFKSLTADALPVSARSSTPVPSLRHTANDEHTVKLRTIHRDDAPPRKTKQQKTASKRYSAAQIAPSAFDFDKLLRIRSDIRLNLAKQVGRIKLKVTQSAPNKKTKQPETTTTRQSKTRSTVFYTGALHEHRGKTMDEGRPNEQLKSTESLPTAAPLSVPLLRPSSKELLTVRNSLLGKGKNRSTDMVSSVHFPLDTSTTEGEEMNEVYYGDDWSTDEELELEDEGADNATSDAQVAGGSQSGLWSEMAAHLSTLPCSETIPEDPSHSFGDLETISEIPRDGTLKHENGTTTLQYPDTDIVNFTAMFSARKADRSLPTTPDRESASFTDEIQQQQEETRETYESRLAPDPPLYQHYLMMTDTPPLALPRPNANTNCSHSPASDESPLGRNSTVERVDSTLSSCTTTTSGSSSVETAARKRRERLTAASSFGSQRSLWCELAEVRDLGLLERMESSERKLQEAQFEVITSEASYLRSLNFLITHFMAAPEMSGNKTTTNSFIDKRTRKHLFSNILAVRDCSEKLLCELESRMDESVVLEDVCDVLTRHFESSFFSAYVKYCTNQVYQDRTLKTLKQTNGPFLEALSRLESDRRCQGLDMRSFLMLPMQRVTRYPLLVIAVLERIRPDSPMCQAYKSAQQALHFANEVVKECNEGARRMERTEQLAEIESRLIYKTSTLRRVPLVNPSRYVIKSGLLTRLLVADNRQKASMLLSRQRRSLNALLSAIQHRGLVIAPVYLLLFTDLLMVAKKKQNNQLVVKDYCHRRFVEAAPLEMTNPRVPPEVHQLQDSPGSLPTTEKKRRLHLVSLTLMQNAFGKQVELLLNCDSETDRERWLNALRPPASSKEAEGERLYAEWDCPQARAVHPYEAQQEDELELQPGDMLNVLRKMPDGWYQGERTRDGRTGWFPGSYVQEVLNDHVRAKNYRQRLRLIQAAESITRTASSGSTPSPGSHLSASRRKSGEGLSLLTMGTTPATHLRNLSVDGGVMNRLRRMSNPKGFFTTNV